MRLRGPAQTLLLMRPGSEPGPDSKQLARTLGETDSRSPGVAQKKARKMTPGLLGKFLNNRSADFFLGRADFAGQLVVSPESCSHSGASSEEIIAEPAPRKSLRSQLRGNHCGASSEEIIAEPAPRKSLRSQLRANHCGASSEEIIAEPAPRKSRQAGETFLDVTLIPQCFLPKVVRGRTRSQRPGHPSCHPSAGQPAQSARGCRPAFRA